MITINIDKIIKIFAVIADIVGVIAFFIFITGHTAKDFLCNPFFQVLSISLPCTLIVYSAPAIFTGKWTNLGKILSYTLVAIIIILGLWFLPTKSCRIDSSEASGPKTESKDKQASTTGPTLQMPKDSVPHPKEIASSIINKPHKRKAPISSKENKVLPDTSKPVAKFDLKGSTFNGPTQLGDHNTQNNTTAERALSDAEQSELLARIKIFQQENGLKNCITLYACTGSTGKIVYQIDSLLRNSGYNVNHNIAQRIGAGGPGSMPSKGERDSTCIDLLIGYYK